ncbi:MAG: ABC transporter ATP-binding protein [Smithellaceae bacterium]|jgi:ATP-binding cassette subfamily B protein
MHPLLRTTTLFWKYWRRAIVTYFCLLAGAGLALVIPSLTGQAINLALGTKQTHALVITALLIGGAGILGSVFAYFQSYNGEYLSQKVAYDLRNKLYNQLQTLSYAFHDRSQTGQLMSRATSDIEAIRGFIGFALLRGVYLLVLLVAITVLLFTLNWKLALIGLSVIPFISLLTIVINRTLRLYWMKIQQGLGSLGTIIQENLVGAKVVRAFAREDFESKKFRHQAEEIYNLEIGANNLLATNSPLMSFAILLAMGGVLWYGGTQVISGVITQGELVEFLLYLVMLSMPIRMLGWLTILFSRASASGKRIFEILDQSSPVNEKPDAKELKDVKGDVVFENVSFGYDSQGSTLKNVNFEAKRGQIIALVGASGSGKSTIANLIPRFYDVTSGRITIDGVDVRDATLASLRRNIGTVHQDTFLFSATIRENIAYGKPNATLEEIIAAAKQAHLHDFINGLPAGYETWVGERGITLSGGQKQRLAIARTLLLNTHILIMDDSTSSVDPETEHEIQQTLAELPAGRTTLIIAHRLRSVQQADLILVLENGQIVERGKHEELLARGGIYKQLYNLQFQNQEPSAIVNVPSIMPEQTGPISQEIEHRTSVNTEQKLDGSLSKSDDVIFGKPYDSRVVSRMVKYFAPYKVALPLTIAATLLYTFTIVANPFLVGMAENKYIVVGNIQGLKLIMLLFLGNAILFWASYYTQIRAEAKLGQSILLNLRSQVFDHVQRLSVKFFDKNEVGRIMSRIQNDVGELGDFLDSGAFWVTGEIVTLVAIMVTLFFMDVRLAIISVAVIPFLLIFLFFWQRWARRSFIKVRQAISAVNASLQENIAGVRAIQSLSREDLNSQQFEQVNNAHFEANMQSVRFSAGMTPVVELLVAMATSLIVLFGGERVLGGTLLVGTLLAFILYIQNFFDPIRSMTMEYTQLQRAMASGSRVFELIDVKPEVVDSLDSIKVSRLQGDIVFENVRFGYEPEVEILHDVNFHISPGSTVALVGPTGAGKTTIVSLIARFYDVTGGSIQIDGHDIRRLEKASYRSQIGLVLQDPFLFSGSVKENIRYGNLEANDEQVITAARTVGAHDFITKMEKGYNTEVQERGQNLSMGQRQLISLARALLVNPVILLLDEATANIDSQSEYVMQQGLAELMKGRTTVVIAHRLSTIKNADSILVLDKGRIIENGNHQELLTKGGLYARLYEMTYRGQTSKM